MITSRKRPPRWSALAALTAACQTPAPKTDTPPEAPPSAETATSPTAPSPTKLIEARIKEAPADAEAYEPARGRWEPVHATDLLSTDAILRTKDHPVLLAIGDRILVTVSPGSQFRLGELSEELSNVSLEGGRLSASVAGGGRSELLVQVRGTSAEARTAEGDFAVLRSEAGQVTVAGTRGKIRVAAEGRSVELADGEQSVVAPKRAPSTPTKIPGKLLLKLRHGQMRKLKQRSTLVAGEVAPGSVVAVNGVDVPTNDGRFSVQVPLREGMNEVTIAARDALGRDVKRVLRGIEVDTSPPKVDGQVNW